jgi:hypothetical protein
MVIVSVPSELCATAPLVDGTGTRECGEVYYAAQFGGERDGDKSLVPVIFGPKVSVKRARQPQAGGPGFRRIFATMRAK